MFAALRMHQLSASREPDARDARSVLSWFFL
jgi:hypothetical protein